MRQERKENKSQWKRASKQHREISEAEAGSGGKCREPERTLARLTGGKGNSSYQYQEQKGGVTTDPKDTEKGTTLHQLFEQLR